MALPTIEQRRAGGLIDYARNGTAKVAAMRNGKWAKLLKEVDPNNLLSETERNKRAKALERGKMILLAQKSKEASARKRATKPVTAPAPDGRYGCAWCGPIPRDASHRTCERHALEMLTYSHK